MVVGAGKSEIYVATQAGFLCYNLEAELLLWETCFFS